MKKLLLNTILAIFLLASCAYSQEVSDDNIEQSQDYYRRQIIVLQKYSKSNFMSAIVEGDTKMVENYVKSGMSPDSTQMKLPAIIVAISSKQPEVVKTLIDNGANTEVTALGITPLLFAISTKNPQCAKVLIENNADINHAYKGLAPLEAAINKKQYETAVLLINSGAEISDTTIIKAVKSGNEDIKNLVLKNATK